MTVINFCARSEPICSQRLGLDAFAEDDENSVIV
jgi:hypothetical protein